MRKVLGRQRGSLPGSSKMWRSEEPRSTPGRAERKRKLLLASPRWAGSTSSQKWPPLRCWLAAASVALATSPGGGRRTSQSGSTPGAGCPALVWSPCLAASAATAGTRAHSCRRHLALLERWREEHPSRRLALSCTVFGASHSLPAAPTSSLSRKLT